MREKFKYLFKNAGYLMVGNFSSKILVFFLVPLYTSILTTAEYGTYDLVFTTIQMMVPILSLNIIDGVLRFTIEANAKEKKYVYSIVVKLMILACVIFSIGSFLIIRLFHIEQVQSYWIEMILFFFFYISFQFIVQYARGLDDIKGVSIAGIIGTVTVIAFNVLFLLVFRIGLKGYFSANILSFAVQGIFLYIHSKMHSYRYFSFHISETEKKYSRGMILYCMPLIFNTLVWYINGAADRYTVTLFCGIEVNGIYSVAYKIPAILNAVQVIFIQAWQLSAIKEFDSSKSNEFYRKTYRGIQSIIVVFCSVLIALTRVISKILFAADFYDAWVYVPLLLTYIIFNTLSGTVGGVFSAAKDAKAFSVSAIVGSLTNIVLNFALVYLWGAIGAAIATVISSIVIWAMRMHFAKKYIDYDLSKKYFFEYCILFLQAGLMCCLVDSWGYSIQFILVITILIFNYLDLRDMIPNRLFPSK